MSRTDNIRRNFVFNAIKYIAQVVLQFILRTVLIYVLGKEYLGLNGLFTNIFAVLNLAELGIGSAIVFNMYKPIAENDTEKVNALVGLYKKYYLIISAVVLGLGLGVLPFLPHLISGDITVNINIYVLYLMYLINTLVGYFAAHKRSLLFAHQRNDVENKVKIITLFGMTIFQIIMLILTKNYYLFFAVNIVFTILECVLIHSSANKLFSHLNGKGAVANKELKKQVGKNVGAVSLHKMGYVVISSTDNILLSIFFGIAVVGIYSNYNLIFVSLTAICTFFVNAVRGSLGNLIASSSTEYVHARFKKIYLIFSLFSSFTTICCIVLIQPFIRIWTGDASYLLNFDTVILIALAYYFSRLRTASNMTKECIGMFREDAWRPVAECVINLITSVVLAKLIGINGIFIGTILSSVLLPVWMEPHLVYKKYFKINPWVHFKQLIMDFVIMVLVCAACYFTCALIPEGSIWLLLAKFAVCVPLSAILLFGIYLPNKDFRDLLKTSKNFLIKKK